MFVCLSDLLSYAFMNVINAFWLLYQEKPKKKIGAFLRTPWSKYNEEES